MFNPVVPPSKEYFIMGIVIVGGLIDSVVGIVTGTVFGIVGAVSALIP
jgi:hypothetical protein